MKFNDKIRGALFGQPTSKAPSSLTPTYPVDSAYLQLRSKAFSMASDAKYKVATNLSGHDSNHVWGVIMEMGFERGAATIIAFSDGTVSFYSSKGGGYLGMGQNPGPAQAAKRVIEVASAYIELGKRVQDYPLPPVGTRQFYFFTLDAAYSVKAVEAQLSEEQHPLFELVQRGNELFSEIRHHSASLAE